MVLVFILCGLAASVWGGLLLRSRLRERAELEDGERREIERVDPSALELQGAKQTSARPWLALGWAIGAGLIYGLVVRATLHFKGSEGGWLLDGMFYVMTTAFLFGVPFAMGLLTVYASDRRWSASLINAVLTPWVPALLGLAVSAVIGFEGSICIVMAAPIFLFSASLGGLMMRGALNQSFSPRKMRIVLAGFCALPYGLMPLEARLQGEDAFRTVANSIDIEAPAERVWDEIKRVRPIAADELPLRFSHLIGFPKPIEATLSREGIGGIRKASFERGLVFTETVHTWKPSQELAFSIRVDPVPPTALDEHVTIGGPFFDVLDGTYRIERRGGSRVRLHLSSDHRLTTRFNHYASFWSDLVMSDIQSAILDVVKRRAEENAKRGAT